MFAWIPKYNAFSGYVNASNILRENLANNGKLA